MVFYKADTIIITLNVTCTRYDMAENCSFGVNNHSLIYVLWLEDNVDLCHAADDNG